MLSLSRRSFLFWESLIIRKCDCSINLFFAYNWYAAVTPSNKLDTLYCYIFSECIYFWENSAYYYRITKMFKIFMLFCNIEMFHRWMLNVQPAHQTSDAWCWSLTTHTFHYLVVSHEKLMPLSNNQRWNDDKGKVQFCYKSQSQSVTFPQDCVVHLI